jgi:hypothetical protein
MKRFLKALRLLGFAILLIAAAFGVGLAGNFLPGTREQYQNREVRTEQIIKKKEENESDSEKDKT